MTTEQHHRMTCTPTQFTKFVAVIDWMATDAEYADAKFKVDGRNRTIIAERLAWNCFRAASDVIGIREVMAAETKEARKQADVDAKQRSADVHAMLWEKSSRVEVAVVEVVPKGALF